MAEPTSILTFGELLLDAAIKARIAYYGSTGSEAPQIPTDPHDLFLLKRTVNDAVRMFLASGPTPNGWNFNRPVGSFDLWPAVAVISTNVVTVATYTSGTDTTAITVTSDAFYPTMERKNLALTTSGNAVIDAYTSVTQLTVEGDFSSSVGETFAVAADGSYTLPSSFGGEYTGDITYSAATNKSVSLSWSTEAEARRWRQNEDISSGEPYLAAVRVRADTGVQRPRWELAVYPTPAELVSVEFPYVLHFATLTAETDTPPIPFSHDDTLRAAVRAMVEKDIDETPGVDWQYFQQVALLNSRRIDEMSRPRRLTRRRNPASISDFRENVYDRPTVTINT